MKFSFRQILASAGGAVIAATIASLFGFKGTIIGVAIGSAAATFGTTLLAQSIEKGHEAVKQVAVKVPDRTALLRRLGGTSAAGDTTTPSTDPSDLTEEPATTTSQTDQTVEMAALETAAEATVEMRAGEEATAPVTEEIPIARTTPSRRSIPWRTIAATAAVVFVLSLGVVTAIELLAGHPLSALFNRQNSNDPSVGQIFNPPPATTSTTTSTTTTSTTTTSTTTTTVPTSTTSTTTPSSTTTTGLNLFGTTTTTPPTTTTSQP